MTRAMISDALTRIFRKILRRTGYLDRLIAGLPMPFFYSPIQRYKVIDRHGGEFTGFVFDHDGKLWIYADVEIPLTAEVVRRLYDRKVQDDRPFHDNLVPKTHVATVEEFASVVPVGAPLSVDDLQQRATR